MPSGSLSVARGSVMATPIKRRAPPLGLLSGKPTPRRYDRIIEVRRVQTIRQHDLPDGYDIRTVQELLGHQDVQTTLIYTHLANRAG
jgi:integrase